MPEGLFILRVAIGLLLIAHGTQKLFGWFSGHGLAGTAGMFEQIGHRPGRRMAMIAGMSEAGGGLLLVFGLLTSLGAAMIMGTMLVAAASVHAPQGLWNTNGGYELPLTYGLVACALGFTGAGAWSIDHAVGIPWTSGAGAGLSAVVVAYIAGAVTLGRRSRVLESEQEDAYPGEPESQQVQSDPAASDRDAHLNA